MANNDKLLRANYRIDIAYPEYAEDPFAPKVAELNNVFAYDSKESGMVFPISCAILDDSNSVNQTTSDTDTTLTICDVAEVESPTFWNYEVTLDALRDRSLTAKGVFNMVRELTLSADRPFIVITRVGSNASDPYKVGDEISLFGVDTDFPVDIAEDGSLIQHGARFKTSGDVEINFKVVA